MFEPLLSAPLAVQLHAFAAMAAMFLGPIALFRRRRDRVHKTSGYAWALAMAVTIASSFAIFQIRLFGPFSPIHLLSVLASYGMFTGIRAAIRRDISRHRETMRRLYFWALGVAGLFTLMPGRIMSRVLFPDAPVAGFVIAVGVAVAAVVVLRVRAGSGRTTA